MANTNRPKNTRRDAVDNRARLIASAETVFAKYGLDATLDDVARHAGVGVATAYRHFPNKQTLAAEALKGAIEKLAADAVTATEHDDPWEALASFLSTVATRQQQNRGLHHLMLQGGIAPDEVNQHLFEAVTKLFDRAKRAGVLRKDVEATDIGPILVMLRLCMMMSETTYPDLWRRYLTILLDGLRTPEPTLIKGKPLDPEEFEQAMMTAAKSFSSPKKIESL